MVKCHQAALCKAKWMLLLCIRLRRAATHIQNTFINHHIEKLVSYFNSQVFGLSRQCSLAQSEEGVLSFRDDYFNFMDFFLKWNFVDSIKPDFK